MGTLVFENVKIADIHGYEHDAKTHPESQVQQIISSITKFGFNNPILIDENNEIIAGHGRFMTAKAMNLETVPTVKLSHLTDAQKRAYRLTGITHLLENGTVLLPNQQDGEMRDFFDELFKFPKPVFKDMVDSFSQGVRYVDNEYISWRKGLF